MDNVYIIDVINSNYYYLFHMEHKEKCPAIAGHFC